MAFSLPDAPRSAEVVPGFTDNNARISSTTGAGAAQTILRPGRCYVTVSIGDLSEDDAAEWLGAQLRHKTEGGSVRMAWPRRNAAVLPTTAVVDGAGQAGAALAIRGLAAGAVLKIFTPFSFIVGGVSYMLRTTAGVVADGAGKVIVPIGPMLRVSPSDGLALNFVAPVIEGDLDPGPLEWTIKRLRFNSISFKISER